MGASERTGWQPEADVDYGQRLAGFLLWKHRWVLIASALVCGAATFAISLFIPPLYRADATLVVDKALSSSAGLLGGMLGGLAGGSSELETEKQVIISREIAKPVIDSLGLRIEITDPRSPDSAGKRLRKYLHMYGKRLFKREEQYAKLTLNEITVDPELLAPIEYVLHTHKDGSWSIEDQKGQAGTQVKLPLVSFTPVFGPAHVPGQSYKLRVLPDDMSYREFRKKLGVTPVNDKANVLKISFQNPNPFLCRQVVELVIQGYLSRYDKESTQDYDAILEFINKELADVRERSTTLTAELTKYREEKKAYAPTAQGQAAMASIADLSKTLTETRILIKTAETALSSISAKTPEQVYDFIQAPATDLPLESSLMRALAEQLTELQQAKMVKTEAHPDIKRLRSSIDSTIGQIKNSLSSGIKQYKIQESALNSDLGELRGSLQGLPEAEGKVALMMAELDANSEIVKVLTTSDAQTRLKKASVATDVSPLDTAFIPEKPDSPRPALNGVMGAIIGLVLAILCALAFEVSDARLRTLREIRLGLNLPVLAVLPGQNPRGRRWRPMQRDPELLKRIALYLRCQGRIVALIHPLGPQGGYDLAWGLAESAAAPNKPSLIVDADRMTDGIAKVLEKSPPGGLAEIAAGTIEPSKAAVQLSDDRRLTSMGAAQLSAEDVQKLKPLLLDNFATTLLVLPPPLRWLDQRELLALADSVALVLPQRGLAREELAQVAQQLREMGLQPLGVIVTNFAAQRDVLGKRELRYVAVPLEGS